jgi:hypothetical protein
MHVITSGDDHFIGADADEIVRQMRETVWSPPADLRGYMEQVADRVQQMTGARIRTEPEGFLADLAAVGLLRFKQYDA